jgi:hypothetical protein
MIFFSFSYGILPTQLKYLYQCTQSLQSQLLISSNLCLSPYNIPSSEGYYLIILAWHFPARQAPLGETLASQPRLRSPVTPQWYMILGYPTVS